MLGLSSAIFPLRDLVVIFIFWMGVSAVAPGQLSTPFQCVCRTRCMRIVSSMELWLPLKKYISLSIHRERDRELEETDGHGGGSKRCMAAGLRCSGCLQCPMVARGPRPTPDLIQPIPPKRRTT